MLILSVALLLGNLHLVGLTQVADWIFRPAEVASGQWWRLFSHPFVHLTWYHLVLDGAAFFLLYGELRRKGGLLRLSVLLCCGGGSLLAAWLWAPQVSALGLCGLSGTAHGLMAFSGLNQMRRLQTRWVGVLVFGLVVGKSILEGLTGQVLFTFMHMGLCGTPIAMAHLGGVAGGMAAYAMGRLNRMGPPDLLGAIGPYSGSAFCSIRPLIQSNHASSPSSLRAEACKMGMSGWTW